MTTRRMFLRRAIWTPPVLMLATACSGASSGIKVALDHGPTAKLGEEMTFTMTVVSVVDAPTPKDQFHPSESANVGFALSPGLSSSDPNWKILRGEDGQTTYSRAAQF